MAGIGWRHWLCIEIKREKIIVVFTIEMWVQYIYSDNIDIIDKI